MDTEKQIIRAVLAGNTDAFSALVNRHGQAVFRCVGRRVPSDDVENVCQEAFLSAFKSLKTYGFRQPFENWLIRIARRRACDYWRGRERVLETLSPELEPRQRDWLEKAALSLSVEEHKKLLQDREAAEMVGLVLGCLEVEDRALIEGMYFEGISLGEMAGTLEWSIPKTKVRAFRARLKLRNAIKRLLG
jgi:RNA polymerase sigma-70 factor (ECF subfamily)